MARKIEVDYQAAPTPALFHQDNSFVRALLGPFGSGKSVACVMEILLRANAQPPGPDGIRRSRWAAVRNTFPELRDTTIQTWNQWVPRELQDWRATDRIAIVKWPGVELEVLFRALDKPDDVGKLLSLELTGAWLNEAREIPRAIFDTIQGRVGRFPPGGGGGWFGIILDSNPPDTDHWIYTVFEERRPDGYRIWHQPSGLGPDAENIDNLPPHYYERLQAGKDAEWINVYLHGQYGFVKEGKPVFPEYRDQQHCAQEPITPAQGQPLWVGIDFGLTPAAIILQEVAGQWRALAEVVTEDMGAVRFGELLKGVLQRDFRGHSIAGITGDPAGEGRSQVDERTPFDVLRAAGIDALPADTNDFTIRREAVARHLMRMTMTGEPGLIVSPSCRVLRKALGGGYAFKRLQVTGDERYRDYPDKNRYSHVADALQYALLGAGEGSAVIGGDESWRRWDAPRPRVSVA